MVIYSNFIRNTVCNGRLVKKDTGGQAILKMPCLRDLFAPNGLPSGSFDDFEHFWISLTLIPSGHGQFAKKDHQGQAFLKLPCPQDLCAPNGLPPGSFHDFEHFWMRKKEKKEKEKEEEGQEAPYNWLTPDHPPLAAFTGNTNKLRRLIIMHP